MIFLKLAEGFKASPLTIVVLILHQCSIKTVQERNDFRLYCQVSLLSEQNCLGKEKKQSVVGAFRVIFVE